MLRQNQRSLGAVPAESVPESSERVPLPLAVQLSASEQHWESAADEFQEEREEQRKRWESSFLGRLQEIPLVKKLARQGIGLAAIAGLLVAVTLVSLALNQASREKVEHVGFSPPLAPQKSNIELLEEAEEALRAYCDVKEWRDLIPLVRHPDVVEPLMEKWYSDRTYEPLTCPDIKSSSFLTSNGRSVVTLSYFSEDVGCEKSHLLEQVNEVFKVDWEIAAGYQVMPWEEFVQSRPWEGSKFRVHFLKEKQGYYNMAFSDPNVWESYRLDVHGTSNLIHAYVRRGTKLSFILRAYAKSFLWSPAILRLKMPAEGFDGNHVEITAIEKDSWLVD